MPFRAAPLKKFVPIAGVLVAFQAGWIALMLYVLPWLEGS
jgi:hypothetical protein